TLCESGDVIQFISAGGGGYGDPLERDPAAVERDMRNEYVSIERAREEYGVVIDPKSLGVDVEKTRKLREQRKRGG
ncbi:MAG: hydantoinase B/oxoprolinase family protein, partial [Deltaproteobacteria bacterium]|nr:hydantoinase B/oxoprolinase family protein [Deltaproteobacteria bacterium]